MSNAILSQVRKLTVKGPQRAVLLVLADRADDSGQCWPSHSTLARESGLARSTVKKVLLQLREAGLIRWEQRRDDSGDLTSNRYFLAVGGRPGAGRGVGRETAKGRPRDGYKASEEAPVKAYTNKFRQLP
jgi:DNA-binding transcriptional MocR family regulator